MVKLGHGLLSVLVTKPNIPASVRTLTIPRSSKHTRYDSQNKEDAKRAGQPESNKHFLNLY